MNNPFLLPAVAIFATVLALLVFAWTVNTRRPHQAARNKSPLRFALHMAFVGFWNTLRGDVLVLANSVAEKTHINRLSKLADAAHSYRYLLVKTGSDADHIAVNGAGDLPLGVCSDTPEAAEDVAAVDLFAATGETRLMVASEAIAAGAYVFTAAAGKVQDEPAVAGTYYLVGRARTAAGADLDVIEVESCLPIKLTVLAALTSTDGTAAGAADLAALKAEAEKIGDDVRAIAGALAASGLVKVLAA